MVHDNQLHNDQPHRNQLHSNQLHNIQLYNHLYNIGFDDDGDLIIKFSELSRKQFVFIEDAKQIAPVCAREGAFEVLSSPGDVNRIVVTPAIFYD